MTWPPGLAFRTKPKMASQLLSGTRNPARVEMLRHILRGLPVKILTLEDLCIDQQVEEDGLSTAANAEKKARFYYVLAGIPTLAMDGGLNIDRFPPEKQPGVLVKRAPGLGASATEAELLDYYIHELNQIGGESAGTWTASQALALSAERVLVYSYTFAVRFTTRRRGQPTPGRALDCIMLDPSSGRYYNELALDERPYHQATRDFLLQHLSDLDSAV